MPKDFDGWNREKKRINDVSPVFANEREIWWCSLGVNVGDEEDGKNMLFERPVLVLKKFNARIVLAVPLTTKVKPNPYYFPFAHDGMTFAVILSQVRLVSTKRFTRLIWKMGRKRFGEIKRRIGQVIL
jgi:mRNA-degrading endonuclease toxin of MazEF toxin-antitoxin module